MAKLTEQLLKYPATNKIGKTSSVLPFCYDSDNKKDFSKSGTDLSEHYNMSKIVDTESWKAGDKESFVEYITEPSSENKKLMLFKVMVDYKKDGESENGKHPVGWPRCNLKFNVPKDFSKYEGLFFRIKFSSNRNESAKNYTHLTLECKNLKNERVFSYDLLGARKENEWIPVMIPFNEENDYRSDFTLLKSVSFLNMVAPERFYPDKTEISFLIDGPYLCSAKETFIANVGHPHFLLKTNNSILPVLIDTKGINFSSPLKLKLLVEDSSGKKIYSDNISIMSSEFKYSLPLDKFNQGKYVLKLFRGDSLLYFSNFEIYSAE